MGTENPIMSTESISINFSLGVKTEINPFVYGNLKSTNYWQYCMKLSRICMEIKVQYEYIILNIFTRWNPWEKAHDNQKIPSMSRRYWIEGGGNRVSVHFAVTFLDVFKVYGKPIAPSLYSILFDSTYYKACQPIECHLKLRSKQKLE